VKYNSSLQKIFEVQNRIKDIHPFLEKVFPIAIVEDNHFYIFDIDSSGKKYIFVKEAPAPMLVPKGVRAAFPLDSYKDKIACVVSGEIFESLKGYALIFHEFIHCNQWEICELKLKQKLEIAQEPMWELNYPFPYGNSRFAETYSLFLKSLEKSEPDNISKYCSRLKKILSKDDFEYMIWQEWKEGFARFIENQIRCRLGIRENHRGKDEPFNRITFYEGGARFITFLGKQEPGLLTDIETLFYKMLKQ